MIKLGSSIVGGQIFWINWLKVIAIILMVFGHAPIDSGTFRIVIYSFHMPLFFMISGFLYKKRLPMEEMKKCLRGLYLPYLVYVCLLYIYALFNFGDEFSIKRVFCLFLGSLEDTSSVYSHLWFLIALMSMRMIVSFFTRINVLILGIVVLLFNLICNNSLLQITYDVFQLHTAVLCLPFFVFGMLLRQYNLLCLFPLQGKIRYVVLSLSVLFVAKYSILNGDIDTFKSITGNSLPIFYCNALIAGSLLFYSCKLSMDCDNKIIHGLAGGTLLILAFHKFFIGKFIELFGISDSCFTLLFSVIIVLSFYYPIKFVHNTIPFMLGK